MRGLTLLPLLLGLGCNQYEMFRVAGFEQASFNNDADILFVIDNSDSMQPVASDLALNFQAFINKLASEEGSNVSRETLTDAVRNYLRETGGETLYIDYQLAITTSSIEYTAGQTTGIDPGEAGTLAGDPEVISRDDDNVALAYQRNLLCNATCWDQNDVPAATEAFECTDTPAPGAEGITREYLDCLCGVGGWTGNCGSGNEMGLESAYMALCRAVESPPDSCYEYEDPNGEGTKPTVMNPGEELTNPDLLRPGAQTLLVLITDEGDGSYRQATGDSDADLYAELFEGFEQTVRMAVVGPNRLDDGSLPCNSGNAQPWAAERYQNLVSELGGAYYFIEAENDAGDCAYADFARNLEQIGELLSNLLTLFPLQSIPDIATIEVWVDDVQIAQSEVLTGSLVEGNAEYGDGWSYEASENAIAFHGAAIPAYNSDVRIYYRPIGGTPRDLPTGF